MIYKVELHQQIAVDQEVVHLFEAVIDEPEEAFLLGQLALRASMNFTAGLSSAADEANGDDDDG